MSVSKRFIISFSSNFLKAGLNFFTSMLIARNLAPEHYGEFSYLIFTFTTIRVLLDAGASNAFMTFTSERPRGGKFYKFFTKILSIQFVIPLLVIMLSPDYIISSIWDTLNRDLLVLAFVSVFLQNTVWGAAISYGESIRATGKVAVLSCLVSVVHFFIVLFYTRNFDIDISSIYIFVIIEFTVAFWVSIYWLNFSFDESDNDCKSEISLRFKSFCIPLFFQLCLSSCYLFLERWLLTKSRGFEEQAFFSLGLQVSAVTLIATTSILKIMWKEVSQLHYENKSNQVGRLYITITKSLFSFSVLIVSSILPWTEEFISLLLGDEYTSGLWVFFVLLFLPIYQSLGQVAATMFMSLGLTKKYSQISALLIVPNLMITYYMLSPQSYLFGGLGLGAESLAIKYIAYQFISVGLLTYILHSYLGIKGFVKNLVTQVFMILSFTMLSFLLKYVSSSVLDVHFIARFLLSSLILLFISYKFTSISDVVRLR